MEKDFNKCTVDIMPDLSKRITIKTNPTGICVKEITLVLNQDGIILDLQFTGGCKGNLNVISNLVKGKHYDEYYQLFKGNKCGNRETSCADQLAELIDSVHNVLPLLLN